jgi:site-specific DNA-methyltransferase (adenine-specific)
VRSPQQEGLGRFPANILLDAEAGALLDAQSGYLDGGSHPTVRNTSGYCGGLAQGETGHPGARMEGGGASRFFYCAKASGEEREGNDHPTVKPVDLMRWLVRLVTRPGGRVLDPFAGSGSTLVAAILEGMTPVGIELLPEHCAIIRRRTAKAAEQPMLFVV